MSQIIEDEIFKFNKPLTQAPKSSNDPFSTSQKKFPYQNQLNAKTFEAIAFCNFQKSDRVVKRLAIPFRKRLFDFLDVWYTAKLNEQLLYEQEKIIIVLRDRPYQIQHYKRKLQVMRQICAVRQGQPKFVKMYITEQGVIELIIPKLVLNENMVNSFRFNSKNLSRALAFTTYVQNLIKFCINDAKKTIRSIFKSLTNEPIPQEYIFKQPDKQMEMKMIKFDLFRYMARSSIELRFDCTEGSALYEQVVDITVTEEKEMEQRISLMKQANKFKLDSVQLYFFSQNIFGGRQKQAFSLTAKEKQITKNLLQIPQILPTKQANSPNNVMLQNKYMFNNIVLELPKQNHSLVLLGESGFGKIQYGAFNFWYVMSSKLEQLHMDESFKQNNMIKNKYLVVKSPKVGNDRESILRYKAKQMHQLQIINKLKGISCALIPRFYKVERFFPEPYSQLHNEYILKYENALLSELTSCYGMAGYNLGNLIENSWQTLTIKKIIQIMSQIAQGLRFLHINKIIHLDMKPQNVLFIKGFIIKIIDFGQAFHPEIPYQDSPPAYSYPYGCPEIAQQLQVFQDKSDVFSFGMILYELIYGKDLIHTHPSRLLREYRQKSFGKRLIFNPQEMENYSDNFILPILNHLIIKSLSPDIEARPSMTWISVMLKKILELLP